VRVIVNQRWSAACAAFWNPTRCSSIGSCDPALKAWQLRMNAWGYDFDGTGCYGEETRRAALALQRRYKLAETGRLGPRTWRAAWDTPP
jgi:resuscitation-promoting factor RpfA